MYNNNNNDFKIIFDETINNIVSPLKTDFLTSVWEKTLSVDIKNELSLPQC